MKIVKWLSIAFAVLVIIGVASSLGGGGDDPADIASDDTREQLKDAGDDGKKAEKKVEKAEPEPEPEPEMTVSQENAIESAESYLDLGGFSKAGLIQQLSSKFGDGYPKAGAVFAVDNVDANWKEEAVEAAQSYLDLGGFSRNGLIQQLTSKAGDQFTQAEAVYAVNKVGL